MDEIFKNPEKQKTVTRNVNLPEDLYFNFRKLLNLAGKGFSPVVNILIKKFVEENKDKLNTEYKNTKK